MNQLLLHLLGDYLLQTDKMALYKTSSHRWAALHALLYSLGFVWLAPSLTAWLVIFGTHFLIDRYRLATCWVRWVNGIPRAEAGPFGFRPEKPAYISFWVMVIIDNTLHLVINQLSITWL